MPRVEWWKALGAVVLVALCTRVALAQNFDPAPENLYWPTAPGARCVNLSTIPTTEVPTICYDYITYESVYIDDNQDFRLALGRLAISNTWDSPECVITSYRMVCVDVYRPCYEVPVPLGYGKTNTTNETVAVGGYVCRQGCLDVYRSCYEAIADALSVSGAQYLLPEATSCDPPWVALYGTNWPGVKTFPNTTYYTIPLTANNGSSYFNFTLPCYSDNFNISTPPPLAICPSGMYFHDGSCKFDCPQPLLTDDQFDAIAITISVFGWISFIACIILLVSFSLDPDKQSFPADLLFYLVVCVLLLSFSFVLGSILGFRNMDCESDTEPNTWGAPGCTIQGILFVYFSLASVFWWFTIALNYFLMFAFALKSTPILAWGEWLRGLRETDFRDLSRWKRWETVYVGYHIFAWGVPAIPVIIALAAHRLGYNGYGIWCTIHSDATVYWTKNRRGGLEHAGGDPANGWNLLLLSVPILSALALGVIMLAIVVGMGLWKGGISQAYKQIRLILFMGFFVWIYVFVFSFEIHLAVETEAQYDAYDEYITCAFFGAVLEAVIGRPLYCPLDNIINFPLWYIADLNLSATGLIIFLVLGTTRRMLYQLYFFLTLPLVMMKQMDPVPINGPGSGSGGPALGRGVGSDASEWRTQDEGEMEEVGAGGDNARAH